MEIVLIILLAVCGIVDQLRWEKFKRRIEIIENELKEKAQCRDESDESFEAAYKKGLEGILAYGLEEAKGEGVRI